MHKTDLVKEIATQAGLSQKDASASLESFLKIVTKALKKGDNVTLIGFGSFKTVKRAARKGRNPQTGKEITIKNKTAFGITITPASGTIFIDSANTGAANVTIGIEASNNWIKLISDGTQWNVIRALF